MRQYDKHYFPSRLDDQEKFLWWDRDVLAIAIVGLLIGIGIDQTLAGFIAGVALAVGYSKLKTGKHPGMANHLLYWHTGMPGFKGLPRSCERDLIG